MTSEHGWQTDAWLDEVWLDEVWLDEAWPKVDAADILVVGGPLWLGENAQHIGYVIPPAADAEGRGRYSRVRQPSGGMERGGAFRFRHKSRVPLRHLRHQ
jgi:hypothetical protein